MMALLAVWRAARDTRNAAHTERTEAQKRFDTHHERALAAARAVYLSLKDQSTVIREGEGPGYTVVSAAGPDRIAWEEYFYTMLDLGERGWDGKDLFDKALATW